MLSWRFLKLLNQEEKARTQGVGWGGARTRRTLAILITRLRCPPSVILLPTVGHCATPSHPCPHSSAGRKWGLRVSDHRRSPVTGMACGDEPREAGAVGTELPPHGPGPAFDRAGGQTRWTLHTTLLGPQVWPGPFQFKHLGF